MKCVDDRLSPADGNSNGAAEVYVLANGEKSPEYGHLINDAYLSCYIALKTDDKLEVVCLLEDKKCFYTVDLLVDGLLCKTAAFKPKKNARFPITFPQIIGRKTAARNWTRGKMIVEAVSDAIEVSTVGRFPKTGTIEVTIYRGEPDNVGTSSCKNLAPTIMEGTFYSPKHGPHPEILPKHRVMVTDEVEMKASACTRARKEFAAERPGNGPWATFCFIYRSLESIQGCPTRTLKASSSALHFTSPAPTLPLTNHAEGLFVQRGQDESSEGEDAEDSDGRAQVYEAQSQVQGMHITQTDAVKTKPVSLLREIAIPPAHGRHPKDQSFQDQIHCRTFLGSVRIASPSVRDTNRQFAQSGPTRREDSPAWSGSTELSEIKTEEPAEAPIQTIPMENVPRDTSPQPSQSSTEGIASSSFNGVQHGPLLFSQVHIPRDNSQTAEKDGHESRNQARKQPKQVIETETEVVIDELAEETTEKRSEKQTSETEKGIREENPLTALDHLEKDFETHNLDGSNGQPQCLAQNSLQTPPQPEAQSENPAFAHSHSQAQTTQQHSTLPTTDMAPIQVALVPRKSNCLKRTSPAWRAGEEPDAKRTRMSTSPTVDDFEALKAKINESRKRGLRKQEENRERMVKIEARKVEKIRRNEFAALQKQLEEVERFLAEQDEEEKRLNRLDEVSDMEE